MPKGQKSEIKRPAFAKSARWQAGSAVIRAAPTLLLWCVPWRLAVREDSGWASGHRHALPTRFACGDWASSRLFPLLLSEL